VAADGTRAGRSPLDAPPGGCLMELVDQIRQEQLGDVWVALGALGRLVDETEQNDYIDNQERIVRDALLRIENQLVGLYEQLEAAQRDVKERMAVNVGLIAENTELKRKLANSNPASSLNSDEDPRRWPDRHASSQDTRGE